MQACHGQTLGQIPGVGIALRPCTLLFHLLNAFHCAYTILMVQCAVGWHGLKE